jgi:hypothetical protein
MITCIVWADLGLKNTGDERNEPVRFNLAIFNHDIGVQVGNKLTLLNLSKLDYLPTNEIEIEVKERRQILKLDSEQDSFELYIEVGIQQDFQEIRKTIKKLNPGKYENIDIGVSLYDY